ncbi:AAA family ATPase [Spirosoma migulaei]
MPVLYIDNFRGFEKTFLELKEINFFVGENSTGKTSLLKLIGILASPSFWRYNQFGEDLKSLGQFSDIITNPRVDSKDFFEIGILGEENSETNEFSAIKLIFIEKDSSPSLKDIKLINKNIEIHINIDGSLIKYRLQKKKFKIPNSFAEKFKLFKDWVLTNKLIHLPFIRKSIDVGGVAPLLEQLTYSLISNGDLEIEEKLKIPYFLENIAWTAPVRSQPEKTYDRTTLHFEASGKHSPYVLQKYLLDDTISRKILTKFGKDSGLYDDIIITELKDSSHKSNSFELQFKLDNRILNITNVGYGISQVLPLIVEVVFRPAASWFAIQQPEIHLHPRAQAAFGDFVFKSNQLDKHKFIIETHSDFIIDRCRIKINKNKVLNSSTKQNQAQVIFFSRSLKGNHLGCIAIQNDGSYEETQPAEFRNFFIREQLELLNI